MGRSVIAPPDGSGPAGGAQEVYALLVCHRLFRTAIIDATTQNGIEPDRGGFTTALQAAGDQLVLAAGIIADDEP